MKFNVQFVLEINGPLEIATHPEILKTAITMDIIEALAEREYSIPLLSIEKLEETEKTGFQKVLEIP